LRALRQTPGKCHALSLSARQISGAPVGIVAQPHGRQMAVGLRPCVTPPTAAGLGGKADIVAHRHMWPQRIGLEYHADRPRLGGDMTARCRYDLTSDVDLPLIDLFQPGDQPQQRAFPAARRPDDRDEFAPRDGKINTRYRRAFGESLGNAVQVQRHVCSCL